MRSQPPGIAVLTAAVAVGIAVVGLCGRRPPQEDATAPSVVAGTANDSPALPISRQQEIWLGEHVVFLLDDRFLPKLCEHLQKDDRPSLQRLFRPDAIASLSADTSETSVSHPSVTVAESLPRVKPRVVSIAELGQRLTALHAALQRPASFAAHILRIQKAAVASRSAWTIRLRLTATGRTAAGRVMEIVSHHELRLSYRREADIGRDPLIDSWRLLSFRRSESPGGLMREVTKAAGLDRVEIQDNWNVLADRTHLYNTQLAVADFDGDGWLDIAISCGDGPQFLLKGTAEGRFIDVTTHFNLPAVRPRIERAFLATWLDFDNDGFPDLLLGQRLYRNDAGKRFVDVTANSGLRFGPSPMGCTVADYDCDGRVDLYVLYHHREETESSGPVKTQGWVGDNHSGVPNRLWRNLGNGRFADVTERSRAGGGNGQSFAAVWFHANDDRFPDLYIANDFGPNVLLLNDGKGRFQDVTQRSGVGDFATSMGVAAGDLDGDGRSDLYVANMFSKAGRRIIAHVSAADYPPGVHEQILGSCAGNRLYLRSGKGTAFREVSEPLGVNPVGWCALRRHWWTWTATGISTSTRPPALSVAVATSRTAEPACGGLSCHGPWTGTARSNRSDRWRKTAASSGWRMRSRCRRPATTSVRSNATGCSSTSAASGFSTPRSHRRRGSIPIRVR